MERPGGRKQARKPASATSRRWPVVVLMPLVLGGSALATWWLVGDQSSPEPAEGGLDYSFGPWQVPIALEITLGIAGLLLTLAALLWTGREVAAGRMRRRFLLALALITVAGVIAGVTGRVMTAGVIGANLGAGLALVLALPLVLILLGLAIWKSWQALTLPQPRH